MKRAIAILLMVTGAVSIAWPFLPQDWGLWQFIGWLFSASDDQSMGIQYMFFWMATFLYGLIAVPVGAGSLANQSARLSTEEREALEFAARYVAFRPDVEKALRAVLKRLS